MGVKAYFMEPTMTRRLYLRRYTWRDNVACPVHGKWGCDAKLAIGDEPFEWEMDADDGWKSLPSTPAVPREDPRWPTLCEACHQPFAADAEWDVFQDWLYRRVDTGEIIPKRTAPAGALWYEEGPHYGFASVFPGGGPDGKVLCARTPGGDWCIDSRCSNCTMKEDNAHRCWVRHGDPRTGNVTVDKNGLTCKAGGGSIDQKGRWHGFLRNGEFVPA